MSFCLPSSSREGGKERNRDDQGRVQEKGGGGGGGEVGERGGGEEEGGGDGGGGGGIKKHVYVRVVGPDKAPLREQALIAKKSRVSGSVGFLID